jgi:hypothetical protein
MNKDRTVGADKGEIMSKKMKITDLKKELGDMERKNLEKLVCEIYKKDNLAASIINSVFLGNEYLAQMLNEYKEKMYAIYFPNNLVRGFSQMEAKKLIAEYKKISVNQQYILDLMLYYVECGTDFTNTYGDIDMAFYNSLISVFNDFVRQIEKQSEVYLVFRERLVQLTYEVRNIGWGYCDYIQEEVTRLESEYMEEE